VWAAFVFVFFSVSHSKLPSYILPMFPALALLAGRTLANTQEAEVKALRVHVWLPIVAALAVCCLVPFADRSATNATPLAVVRELALYFAAGALVFMASAFLARRQFARSHQVPAIMLLSAGSLIGVSLAITGYDAYGQLKSSKAMAAALRPLLRPDSEFFAVRTYDQTLPFYLQRPVIQVDYRDEFEFGQKIEPGKSVPTIAAFVARWRLSPRPIAMLDDGLFEVLQAQGVDMKMVYEDARHRVVMKP
jgi:4-amino-4-deoxy-L-arabinose transferase-like glycosyltransferase